MVTVDASVLVAAGARDDPFGPASLAFLEAVVRAGHPIHQPTLTLVEVSAAIARRTGDAALAREAGFRLLAMPGLVLHPLDLELAADAAAIAGRTRLRGADAIYAAVALRHGVALVTVDDELLSRTPPGIVALSPSDWLTRHG